MDPHGDQQKLLNTSGGRVTMLSKKHAVWWSQVWAWDFTGSGLHIASGQLCVLRQGILLLCVSVPLFIKWG